MCRKSLFLLLYFFILPTDFYASPLSRLHGEKQQPFHESPYFLVILVDAKHLDYTDNQHLIRSLIKHPRTGSKTREVGHAWILLKGMLNGASVEIEGGHSGELGENKPKYLEGIVNLMEFGYANPSQEQMQRPRYEPNPVRYLWEDLQDGFFQRGSGGHIPSYAAKIDLDRETFLRILHWIDPRKHCYKNYALTTNQCCSFAIEVADLAGWRLDGHVAIRLDKEWKIGRERLRLWEDPFFSFLEIASPDKLEASLIDAVKKGQAQYAFPWYIARGKSRSGKTCAVLGHTHGM